MNTVPRLALPEHDYFAELRWPALLGGDTETIGPFRSGHERTRAIAAARAPYPGNYQPSARLYAIERPR